MDPATPNPWAVVDIFHKERGGKGVWKAISQATQVRVTKNIGKRVKVVIKSSVKFTRSDLTLRLFDLSFDQEREGQFCFESSTFKSNECGGETADVELKLFTLAKKLFFQADIQTEQGPLIGRSDWFGTHNSGKQRKKTLDLSDSGEEREPSPKKAKIEPVSETLTSSKRPILRPLVSRSASAAETNQFSPSSPPPVTKIALNQSPYPPQLYYSGTALPAKLRPYPEYHRHIQLFDFMTVLRTVSELQGQTLVWHPDTPPSSNPVLSRLVHDTIRLFGHLSPPTETGDYTMPYLCLVPVVFAGILQHGTYAPQQYLKELRHMSNLSCQMPYPQLQNDVDIMQDEAEELLNSHGFPSVDNHSKQQQPQQQQQIQPQQQPGHDGSQLDIQAQWVPNSGMSYADFNQRNSWNNISILRLAQQQHEKPKFIFSFLPVTPQTEPMTIAVYHYDSLFHSDNHAERTGIFSFVVLFNRPFMEFPFNAYVSLHDMRIPPGKQILCPCRPSSIPDFPHIWVVGYLSYDHIGDPPNFGCNLNLINNSPYFI